MDKFVRRQNIKHYRKLLAQNPTAAERETLQRLLAEEEAKEGTAAQADKKPTECPPGDRHFSAATPGAPTGSQGDDIDPEHRGDAS
jgi:hypothetical protein